MPLSESPSANERGAFLLGVYKRHVRVALSVGRNAAATEYILRFYISSSCLIQIFESSFHLEGEYWLR